MSAKTAQPEREESQFLGKLIAWILVIFGTLLLAMKVLATLF
ncbi:MAG: hypothetical protein ACYDHQ_10650 [Coriobacteriia bacterium]